MKKITIYSLMLCLSALCFMSCNDDEDQLTDSRLTYYPVMTLNGDEFVQVPIGTAYVEQGVTATLRDEDYSSNVVISGTVDSNTAGLYYIVYTVTNEDGYASSLSRTVAVCDPNITTDISGSYTVAEGSNRISSNGVTAYSGYSITLSQAAPGIFYVSDFLGGYYEQRAGYGSSYAMKGYLRLMEDNTLSILSGDVAGWGDSYSDFSNGVYDPATGTISYTVTYAGMDFNVILTL